MADLIRFDPAAATPSLIFDCGELPVDEVVAATDLGQARALIEPYLTDSDELGRLIERAEAADFDLEDSEVEEPAAETSFLRRILGRR